MRKKVINLGPRLGISGIRYRVPPPCGRSRGEVECYPTSANPEVAEECGEKVALLLVRAGVVPFVVPASELREAW